MSKILEALNKLATDNDAHWTSDGLPRLDTVRLLAADQNISREDIQKVAPNFSRTTAAKVEPAEPVVTPVAGAVVEPSAGAIVLATGDNELAELEELEDSLEGQHKSLIRTLAEMDSALAQFHVERAKVVAELDKVIDALESEKPKSSVSAIQGYLQAQNETAQRKAAQVAKLREAGIDPAVLSKLLPGRAPVDASRQRKTNIDGA